MITRERFFGRGFFAIGIEHGTTKANIGTLWRSADLFDAAFIFTVRHRYPGQASDTYRTPNHVPLFHFDTIDDLVSHLPHSCPLIGVEMHERAKPIQSHTHLARACYLLGAEDHGLTREAIDRCHALIQLPGVKSMNVASAGTVVMYDRWLKEQTRPLRSGARVLETQVPQ
jgi:tRNA G18 (ribose-2'-O)-methylase SpoU